MKNMKEWHTAKNLFVKEFVSQLVDKENIVIPVSVTCHGQITQTLTCMHTIRL